jgi:Domain of unknown function (DU1801)
MPYPAPKALLEFLKPYDRSIRELALAVREFVIPEMVPCIETIYDAYNAVAFGYGPSESHVNGAIHVAVYAKYVNLGFNQGAHMQDPAKLLKGTGNNVRHITIKSADDLKHPALRSYLQQARRRSADTKGYPEELKGVRSVVKPASPAKRRPTQK